MPIPQIEVRTRGPKGPATITITSTHVEVVFDKDSQLLTFARNEEDAIGFDVTKIPTTDKVQSTIAGVEDLVQGNPVNTTPVKTARVYAEVSGDKKKLFGVRPLTGSFFAKIRDFAHAEDQLPTPRRYEGMARKKNGETFPYNFEGFTVLVEITTGEWAGTIFPSMLRYLFMDAGDGETAGIRTSGKHAQILANFLENAGLDFDTDTIPLADNILPWLESELVGRAEKFMIVVNKGYIDSYAPAPALGE